MRVPETIIQIAKRAALWSEMPKLIALHWHVSLYANTMIIILGSQAAIDCDRRHITSATSKAVSVATI